MEYTVIDHETQVRKIPMARFYTSPLLGIGEIDTSAPEVLEKPCAHDIEVAATKMPMPVYLVEFYTVVAVVVIADGCEIEIARKNNPVIIKYYINPRIIQEYELSGAVGRGMAHEHFDHLRRLGEGARLILPAGAGLASCSSLVFVKKNDEKVKLYFTKYYTP